jgi:hypothetical protein
MIIYVDDLIILASNVSILKWLKSRLEDEFEMSDFGDLQSASVEDYDVDVRNIDNGVVDIRNNVVDKCCELSKT